MSWFKIPKNIPHTENKHVETSKIINIYRVKIVVQSIIGNNSNGKMNIGQIFSSY